MKDPRIPEGGTVILALAVLVSAMTIFHAKSRNSVAHLMAQDAKGWLRGAYRGVNGLGVWVPAPIENLVEGVFLAANLIASFCDSHLVAVYQPLNRFVLNGNGRLKHWGRSNQGGQRGCDSHAYSLTLDTAFVNGL